MEPKIYICRLGDSNASRQKIKLCEISQQDKAERISSRFRGQAFSYNSNSSLTSYKASSEIKYSKELLRNTLCILGISFIGKER